MGSDYSLPSEITDSYVKRIWSQYDVRHRLIQHVEEKKYSHPELSWSQWTSDPSLFYTSEYYHLALYYDTYKYPLPPTYKDQDPTTYLTKQIKAGERDEVLRLCIVGWPLPVSVMVEYQPLWCMDFLPYVSENQLQPFPQFVKAYQNSGGLVKLLRKGFVYDVSDLKNIRWSVFAHMDAPGDMEALLDDVACVDYLNHCDFHLVTSRYERVSNKLVGKQYYYPANKILSALQSPGVQRDPDALDRFLKVVPYTLDVHALFEVKTISPAPKTISLGVFVVLDRYHPLDRDTKLTTYFLQHKDIASIIDAVSLGFPVADWLSVIKAASLRERVILYGKQQEFKIPEELFSTMLIDPAQVILCSVEEINDVKKLPNFQSCMSKLLYTMIVKEKWSLSQILEFHKTVPIPKEDIVNMALKHARWELASDAIESEDQELVYDDDLLSECLVKAYQKNNSMRDYSFPIDSKILFRIMDRIKMPKYELVEQSEKYDSDPDC